MVTWGVTDAGGRVVPSRQSGDDDSDAVASPENERGAGDGEEHRPSLETAADADDEDRAVSTEQRLPPITVAPTAAGLARAVQATPAALATTGPLRSHPAYRRRPPAMTLGEVTHVPDRIEDRVPDVDVTLVLPPAIRSVLLAAPLSYYLPAEISLREDCTPRLEVCGETRATFEDLAAEAATVLRRVFHLDCLLRRPPGSAEWTDERSGGDLLDRIDLDPDHVRSLSAEARLDRYLAAWEPRFDDALPEWHLSTTVSPRSSTIRALPSLLDCLSVLTLPDAEPRCRPDLLDRTLGDAYRTRGSSGGTDVVAPSGHSARSQGWLAPGRPIEAFKPTTAAFEHRRRYRGRRDADRTVAVVLGDGRMRAEYEDVARAYRERRAGASVDVVASPTRAELRSVLGGSYDLLHYVGHCDDAGLRCTDGHLGAEAIAPCRIPAFVLNACGSYDQGLALVERGSVAGAVTFADVLDRHAARVGTALARLLVEGFSVQRALEIARRRILMGQDYAAVGDGTYAPWQNRRPPGVLWIESAAGSSTSSRERASGEDPDVDDAYEVTYDALTIRRTGDRHPTPLCDQPILNGDAVSATLSREALAAALEWGSFPVVWAGDLYWSGDVKDRFRR